MNRRMVYRGSGFIEKIKKKYDIEEIIKPKGRPKKDKEKNRSNYLYRALEISHHAFVLELGKIRFDGTGEEILNNAKLRKVYLGG